MDSAKKDHFKELLNAQHNELKKDLLAMKVQGMAEHDNYSPTELSNYDNHPADMGSELYLVGMNHALKKHQLGQIQEVESALKRLDEDTYGICYDCGIQIPEERLEALPTAHTCLNCSNSLPQKYVSLKNQRPVEESVIGYPFGRKSFQKKEDDEFEGLDQVNDLMKYGSSDTPQDLGGYEDYEEYYTNEIDRQGVVDPMDVISNEMYKKQLP